MREFTKIRTPDSGLNRVQDNIGVFGQQFTANPLLRGRLIQNIDLSTTAFAIEHKLNRKPLGWILVDLSAAQTVFKVSSDTRFLTLQASGACTVSIWVF